MTRQARSGWSPTRIKTLREDLGLTQEQFAQRIGVASATVSKWECEEHAPTRLACQKLDEIAGGTADGGGNAPARLAD